MSFSSTIQAELGLGTSKFKAGLASASTSLEQFKRSAREDGGARESAKAMKELLTAQEQLDTFRKRTAFDQADAVGKIKIVEGELKTLAEQRSQVEAGTVRHMQLQLEIEQRRVQLQSLRGSAQQQSVGSLVAESVPPVIARQLSLIETANAKLKSLRQTLTQSGAGRLFSAVGIGALIAGYTSALNRAQQLRDTNEKLSRPINEATRAVAEYADALDRAKREANELAIKVLSIPVRMGELVGTAQAMLLGAVQGRSPAQVLRTIKIAEEAERNAERLEAGREAAFERGERRKAKAAEDARQAAKDLLEAQEELSTARIDAAKKNATEEERVKLIALEVADAQEAVTAAKDGTVERAKAEVTLLEKQQELAEAQLAREKQITEEKEKQIAREAALARQRAEANERLQRAIEAQSAALANYQRALSDQSAASFSEVAGGTRGNSYEQRLAAEVQRLRAQARTERDAGNTQLVGGQIQTVADSLSTRANQVQSQIGSLNTAERNPLADVQAELVKANTELAAIRGSLEVVAVD